MARSADAAALAGRGAVRLVAPSGGPLSGQWQRWANRALVPTVTGAVVLRETSCPDLPKMAGCVYTAQPRVIYVKPGIKRQREVMLHELGHVYDLTVLANRDRGRFRKIMKRPGVRWWVGKRPLAEWFAESYAWCARYTRITSVADVAIYDYNPTPAQHRRVCALITTAARDRTPPAPPPGPPPVVTGDPAPVASSPATPSPPLLPTEPAATPTPPRAVSPLRSPSPTRTPESSATATKTPTATPTVTPSVTATASATVTPDVTATATPSAAPADTPTPTPTTSATPSATPAPTVTATPTTSATPTATASPTWTPAATPTAIPSPTETPESTPEPTATAEPAPEPGATPDPEPVETPDPTGDGGDCWCGDVLAPIWRLIRQWFLIVS